MPHRVKPVPIDLSELANALEDHSGLAWYIDAENGDLVPVQKRRPRIGTVDRAFWVVLRRVWARWSDAVVIVNPRQ